MEHLPCFVRALLQGVGCFDPAVKLGIVDEEGRVLSKTEQSVCFDNYETPILTTVLSAAEQFLKEQAVEPVSYTHLDVYKRQGKGASL